MQDQQVSVDERRRAGSAKVIADEIAPLPHDLAALRVEAADEGRPEADVHPSLFHGRGGRSVRIERVAVLRRGHHPHLRVVLDRARVLVNTDHRQLSAVFGGRCQPDAVSPDDRRRPGLARQRRLPNHVLLLAPLHGQLDRSRIPLVGRAAVTGPIILSPRRRQRHRNQQHPRHRDGARPAVASASGIKTGAHQEKLPHLERQPEATKNVRYFVAVRCERCYSGKEQTEKRADKEGRSVAILFQRRAGLGMRRKRSGSEADGLTPRRGARLVP